MKVKFSMKNGHTHEIANIEGWETFRDFSNAICSHDWTHFSDLSINMKEVSSFWEVKN